MIRFFLILLIVLPTAVLKAQPAKGPSGKFFGKVLNASSGKGVEFATIRLFREEDGKAQGALVTGVITSHSGEFTIESVPVGETLTIVVSAIGYNEFTDKVILPRPEPGKAPLLEKDLGNIRLQADTVALQAVEVVGSGPTVRLEADKKVFDVSENAVTAGGTAEDVLKNLPSVSVDMDGNVTLRNNAPQIFVDGRLTTLTIDQIPADAIESIEVITNPSAKYDASGGAGGIINIVLKKERKLGYHGGLRAGVDMRGRFNGGGDLNLREGKINVFAMGSYNQRRSIGTTQTDRTENYELPFLDIQQKGTFVRDRTFIFGRLGMDYFINNRSTITLSHTMHQGAFDTDEDMETMTDTLYPDGNRSGNMDRSSQSGRSFQSQSSSILFKHLFPKEGREFTADATYNLSSGKSTGDFTTIRNQSGGSATTSQIIQRQEGGGDNDFLTVQADYVTPTQKKGKIETGVRLAARGFESFNNSYLFNPISNSYELLTDLTSDYSYTDQVYAAYITYAKSYEKTGFQTGLRAESSFYEGRLLSTGESFKNSYPVSLFPSLSGFYKFSEKTEMQLNVTRRVNRPNFFSLMPFTDYSDSLNISRGNPALKPEFSHIGELTFLRSYGKENTIMATGFFRYVNNLFASEQVLETNPTTGRDAVVNTVKNAEGAYGYGMEITSRTITKKFLELTGNVAVYNAVIEGAPSNANGNWAWYSELNVGLRLPKGFSVQISGEYESRTVYQINSNRGERQYGQQASATAQGYSYPEYEVDLAVRKDFFNKKLIATLSVSDLFKTDIDGSYIETPYFTQETVRKRDQQFFRFNLSYRFGKFDQSVFRRKNTRDTMDGDGGF